MMSVRPRHFVATLFALCALTLSLSMANAQETSASAESEAIAPADDPAWQAYQEAYLALVQGDRATSQLMLKALVRRHPDHPAASFAREALQALAELSPDAPVVVRDVARPAPGAERASALSRAELASFQTVHGIIAGLQACVVLECESARVIVGSAILGGGAGLGLSLLGTRNGITPGRTLLINSGTSWGFFNGLALSYALEVPGGSSTVGLLLGAQLVGTGLGALPWQGVKPTAGGVSLANSAGIWTGVLTFFVHGMTDFETSERALWTSLLVAADLGMIAGAIGASQFPMSRGRTLIIDSGGILGALLGMGSMVLIQGDNPTPGAVFGAGFVGTLGGLGAATYFSRGWDVGPGLQGQFIGAPTDGGMMVGYQLAY